MYFGAAADLTGAMQPGALLYTLTASVTLPLAFVAGGVPLLIIWSDHRRDRASGGSPDQVGQQLKIEPEHMELS